MADEDDKTPGDQDLDGTDGAAADEDTELRQVSKEELERILADHTAGAKSNSRKGATADLIGADLRARSA